MTLDAEDFRMPYRRPYAHQYSTVKTNRAQRTSRSWICSTFLVLTSLAFVAATCFAVVYFLDRLHQLEGRVTHINHLYDEFRSERIECFPINSEPGLPVAFIQNSPDSEEDFDGLILSEKLLSQPFRLSGYEGQLLAHIRVHEASRESYLYVKYRPISGDKFPMYKNIYLKLLHPNNAEHDLKKLLNTREEIDKGASMFANPNGDFWGANFCSTNILERFINNNLICVSVQITDLVTYT